MPSFDNVLIEKLNQLIDDNLSNPAYSIDDLCRDLGISRSQLFRMSKELSGLSPTLYIRQRRLIVARHLLDTTTLRMAEIADRVGIDSPQSFTKFFTQEFGSSPTEYRKNNSVNPSEPFAAPSETSNENGQTSAPVDAIPDESSADGTQSVPSLKPRRRFLLVGLATLRFV